MSAKEIIRIKQSELQELFSILKFKKGKWRNKTLAAKKLGISRPTIDKILRAYPEGLPDKPKRTIPKWVEKFEETQIYPMIINHYTDRKTGKLKHSGKHAIKALRDAWRVLGQTKDPLEFDAEDYLRFYGDAMHPPHSLFVDPLTNRIAFSKAVALRFAMKRGLNKHLVDDPRFITKGLKREKGRKKGHYLEESDIIEACNATNEPDTLIMLLLGVLLGGRFSALSRLTVKDIKWEAKYLSLREVKVGEIVEKDLFPETIELLKRYIYDFERRNRLFHYGYTTYNDRLREIGERINLGFAFTTHVLKHTCVTQMSLHRVDMPVISDWVGTDVGTLMQFYRGGGRKQIQEQILGVEAEKVLTWREFVSQWHPHFEKRYAYLKPMFKAKDGLVRP